MAPPTGHSGEMSMQRWVSLVVGVTLLFGSAPASAQSTGAVAGVVIDQTNAIPLPGVPVEAVGTGEVVYTDLDGRYRLELPAGERQIKVALGGYAEQNVTVQVEADATLEMQVALSTNVFAEEVAVVAAPLEAESSTAAAQIMLRMRAPVVQDNIGALEMRANDDSDAADAMARVTGVSVVDNQSVFVRGLGERYSNTTLAGVTLPTTEPDRRVVPLDLFPTGMIDSVQVSKTYAPDKPSQFAGGLVEIIPLKMPNETSFEFSFGGAFNSITTGKTGLDYDGGRAWTGFDDGTRQLPLGFPTRKVIRGGRFTSDELGFVQSELEALGESFGNVWDPVAKDLAPNQSYSGLFGGRFGKLGIVATMRHSQANQRIEDETRTFFRVGQGGAIETFNGPYTFNETQFTSTVGGVGNVSYQFDPNHRISVDNFYTHVGTDETRTFQGFNSDADNDIRNQRLFFVEEQIRAHHVGGDHLFPSLSNSKLDWKVAYSNADREEPDLREVLYEFDPARDAFVLADESQSGLRQFNDLVDESVETTGNWSTLFQNWAGLPTQVKFGGSYIDRARDFGSRRLRFVPLDTSGIDLSLPAEQIFTPENIGSAFQLKEETRPTDTYAASQEVISAYGMVDLPLAARLRVVAGARLENFRQIVDTFDPFVREVGDNPRIIRAQLDETDIFPAVNVVYSIQNDQNLRFGVSQTVNRPEFRELAPFEFTDVVGGRATVGNPDLEQSLIQNFDVRWEWFPGQSDEVLAASFFYKNFDNPIERIVEPTAQLRTSFTNAESARNAGFEVEARKSLGQYFFVGANYTYVDSEVTLSSAARQVQTSLVRPLAGTSENLFNAMFEARAMGYSARLLWNFFDDRISDVGSLGLPDIIEDARSSLDFVLSKRFERFSLKLAVSNLTDEDYVFTQGGQDQRIFSLGRTVAFGLSVRP